VFPPQTNGFQKPIKFVTTLGKVFFVKESEKASGEELIDKPGEEKAVEKLSGVKPSEQPDPKPKPKPIKFHCGYLKDRYGEQERGGVNGSR
jgi:hypothetical protein